MRAAGAGLRGIVDVLSSRYFCWLALALPAAIQTYRYWQGSIFYGEYLHWTGVFAAELLIATLAITPLRLAFPSARWVRWLLLRRRYLGLATFSYSMLHTGAYLAHAEGLREIVDEALGFAIGSGWIALAIFLLLAATSNDASVRMLGRTWKRLHRFVHAAALLTFAHWLLTAFDPLVGSVHLAVLVLLQTWRLWKQRQLRRAPARP